MKQTAVEWLIEEVHKNMSFIPTHIQEQAKEMFEQQIIDAWEHYRMGSGKRYYENTYGISEVISPTYSGENPFTPIQTETHVSKGIDKEERKIEFFWNGSFVGTSHSMMVDGYLSTLGDIGCSRDKAAEQAVKILKEKYNIDYDINEIEFKWGGRM